MRAGILQGGVVVNIAEASEEFAASQGWVKLPDNVAIGWRYEDGEFLPPQAAPLSQEELFAYAAQRRWEVETGGITVQGVPVPTDRETQDIVDRIIKAYADGDIEGEIDFKSSAGFMKAGEPMLRAVKRAGALHVQTCFSKEAEVNAGVIDGTITTREEIDAAFGMIATVY